MELAKTKRLIILESSLIKKEEKLNELLANHFDTVKQANGQPLNDKRNGHKTLSLWERQNDAIRKQEAEIEKTKVAIEREKDKIANVENQELPDYLKEFLDKGLITQWRKYPNRFFVVGGGRARVIYKDGKLLYSYLNETTQEERTKFISVAKEINERVKRGEKQ